MSRPEMFCKKSLLKNLARRPRPATLFKKRLRYRCFPVKLAKFLRKLPFIEHIKWLLLNGHFPGSFLEFLEHLYFIASLGSSCCS